MRFSTFSYCIFGLHGVGCNQPKARPGGGKFGDRTSLGQIKTLQRRPDKLIFAENPIIVGIVAELRQKTEEDLRLIYQLVRRL